MTSLRNPVSAADHAQGRADAAVTLVEYGDYQCPHCGAAYPVVQQLQQRLGDDLRFVFRNFPLAEMHPDAVSAAMTAEYGAAHAHFWEIHDALFENQQRLGLELYGEIVMELGLDAKELRAALETDTYLDRVQTDFNGGVRSGVNGTPTFFINGQRYDGSHDFESMAEALGETVRRSRPRAR
jgi:protein-disulfide isomerase